ncbi:MAG TPA: hypothetical protein VK488_06090 [Gaiellaceae bacterium]|nr:hypothetical protein [Gaiellaceae bacterium]
MKILLTIAAAMAVAVALSTSSAPASRSGQRADCSLTSTGLVPLTDMGKRRYRGFRGGLYPAGRNHPTAAYLRKGLAAARKVRPIDGKIVLLSIGMSNATAEFSAFKRVADRDPAKNANVTIVDGAQDGWDATRVKTDPSYWDSVDQRLIAAGVSANQVQAVWLKEAIAGEDRRFPKDARALQADLRAIVRTMRVRYPNLHLIYLSSRTYGGYAITGLNPEPAAYDSGYAVRGVIQDRMVGKLKGPWLGWGSYLWTDGLIERSDGLTWTCDDVESDGTHPSKSGVQKVVNLLITFFKTDPTARRWFVSR